MAGTWSTVTSPSPDPGRPNPYELEVVLAAALARITDKQTAAITQAWGRAWAEISEDLLDSLEVILAQGGQVTRMAIVRHQRLAQVLASIADVLVDLAGMIGIGIEEDLDEVLALAERGNAEIIGAQLFSFDQDFEWEPRSVAPDALTAIVRRTTQQVTSAALPLADETYSVILRELTRGVAAGDNPRQMAERMVDRAENHWNFGRTRAETIARTETLDAYREAARVSQDLHADVLAGWVWIAHLGPRTCRSCLALHGEFFTLADPGPYDHQQGRCSRTPVVMPPDGDLGNPETLNLDWVPDAIDHFESLPVADQKKILGRDGWAAWRAGDWPPELWYRVKYTPGWRRSYVPASPGQPGQSLAS